MSDKAKTLIILAGANGAGKTTTIEYLLPREGILEFVNADEIARGLSPFNPTSQRIEAGRLVIRRVQGLLREGTSFAFETTLSGTSQLSWIKEANEAGYQTILYYIYSGDVNINIQRIAQRVKEKGHDVPVADIVRRYRRSLLNLFESFGPVCGKVEIYHNNSGELQLVARKSGNRPGSYDIYDLSMWERMKKEAYSDGTG